MKKILILLLTTLFFQFAYASDQLTQKIQILQNELSSFQPTLRGSIFSIQSNQHHFSFASENVTEESQFYIGSLSKQMTALIFLKSLTKIEPDPQKLKAILNQTLISAFPNSPLLKAIDKPWINQITSLDLLTHRSGLSNYVDTFQYDLNKPVDTIHILRSVSFIPTTTYSYSNTNYLLLARLIEELNQKSFDQTFNEIIAQPLNFIHSSCPIQDNYHTFKLNNYFEQLLPNLNEDFFMDMHNAIGTGNIISSSSDLIKWNKYLHETIEPELAQLIFEKYCRDEEDWIHLGLSSEETTLGPLIGFQGGLDSFHSLLGYLPDHQLHIVILSNNPQDFEKLMSALEKFLSSHFIHIMNENYSRCE